MRRALLTVTLILALVGLTGLLGWLARAAPAARIPAEQIGEQDGPLVWVSVLYSPDADVAPYFVGPVYRRPVGELVRAAGHVPAARLASLAAAPGVIHVPSGDPLPRPLQPDPAHTGEMAPDMAPAAPRRDEGGGLMAPGDWYENDWLGVWETWHSLGITGTGVTIAILDSGVDFGTPALADRYAVQPATLTGTQAYAGWPIAFDDRSLSQFVADPSRAWDANWGWYVNAGYAITGSGVFTFSDPLSPTRVYTVPGTSQSERYHLGTHPDTTLDAPLLLVADEVTPGVYDAVYADLDDDGAFETRMSRDEPVGVLDLTGDGVPDVSAGLLYWIADGQHPPPGAAVYGPGVPTPITGTLLAFMINDPSQAGGAHGTWCASSAVGDDGGAFEPSSAIASFYTDTYGSLVQGPAPGAKVIAMGNVYAGGSLDAWYLFTALGYDGVPGSGDEPQIVTLSYGSTTIDNDGWDWESRYLTYLNRVYGDRSPLFVHSAGNGGYGYGTVLAPKAALGLNVGASTQYGTVNAFGISETVSLPARVNWGDVTSFSGRGPGSDGSLSVDVVANGMAGTGAVPLSVEGDGTHAYVHWRGTSRSVPVAGGIAALAAQAFSQANGRFPTHEELRRLVINGAGDLGGTIPWSREPGRLTLSARSRWRWATMASPSTRRRRWRATFGASGILPSPPGSPGARCTPSPLP